MLDIDNFVQKIAIKYKIPIQVFKEWLFYVEKEIDGIQFTVQWGCKRKHMTENVKKLQNHYIIAYSDKAELTRIN